MRYFEGLSGWNEPKHQEIISDLLYFIRKELDELDNTRFTVVPECPIKSRQLDRAVIPDILIWDNSKSRAGANYPCVILEICRNRGYKSDIQKVKQVVKQLSSLKEAFVFNLRVGFLGSVQPSAKRGDHTSSSEQSTKGIQRSGH
jgi:Uma2 family endonuclease